jgi:hypothetical protein
MKNVTLKRTASCVYVCSFVFVFFSRVFVCLFLCSYVFDFNQTQTLLCFDRRACAFVHAMLTLRACPHQPPHPVQADAEARELRNKDRKILAQFRDEKGVVTGE